MQSTNLIYKEEVEKKSVVQRKSSTAYVGNTPNMWKIWLD